MSNITIHRDGSNFGPYTLEQINEMVKNNQILSTDMGWVEGGNEWQPISKLLPSKPTTQTKNKPSNSKKYEGAQISVKKPCLSDKYSINVEGIESYTADIKFTLKDRNFIIRLASDPQKIIECKFVDDKKNGYYLVYNESGNVGKFIINNNFSRPEYVLHGVQENKICTIAESNSLWSLLRTVLHKAIPNYYKSKDNSLIDVSLSEMRMMSISNVKLVTKNQIYENDLAILITLAVYIAAHPSL